MILEALFTKHLLEVLLIAISLYIVIKAYGTRKTNRAARAFNAFAVANLVFQVADLCMGIYRGEEYLTGAAFGCFIYVVSLIAMAIAAYLWLNYVEAAIDSTLLDSNRKKIVWVIPVMIFAILCIVSIRTGWIFTFDANGKYVLGSLFFLQYVFIFGYCAIAMVRSLVNYFKVETKRDIDKILLIIMLIDTAAVVLQLVYMENMMPVALTLTVLLSYMNVYSGEVQQIKNDLERDRLLQQKENETHKLYAENNARMFALQDDFMSLYDVELESGHYTSFDRDEFYQRNVSDKVVSQTEFFKDLRTNVERVVYEEDREGVYSIQTREAMRRELAEADHFDYYYRIITDDGPLWLKMRLVYKNAEKKNVIVGIFNAEEEMAARQREVQVREELAQTNARLFALEDNFESLYDVELESGHYEVFVKGEFFRDKVLDKLSVPKDYFEELRENIDAVIYEEDRQGLYETLTRQSIRAELAISDHFDYYYRIASEDGPVWLKMRLVYKDAQQKNVIIGVFNAENDVEAAQIAEQKAQLEKDMQMIGGLASGYDALYYVNIDEKTYTIYTSDEQKYSGSQRLFGEGLDFFELIREYGQSEVIHPDDRQLFRDFDASSVRERLAGTKKYSMRFRVGSGEKYRWDEMDVIKYEDTDEHANIIAVGFADRDAEIREEQEHQQQLEDAREAADAANKSKSDFLFSMSHDIRTPMNAITGFTMMAKKYADDEQAVLGYLDKIDVSGKQLLSLVNQVLEMARIESGQIELDEKPVNVQREFDVMATVLSEQAQVNAQKLTCSLQDVVHYDVFADEARMSSVTLNIIGNAMKYTPEGGRIDFTLREVPARKPGYATFVFTVADTGIGMSEEFQKVLFEPFAREKSTTVSKIQGTGLGLPIVKSLVDLMGGLIEVQSELGKGTRFDITVDFRINDEVGAPVEELTMDSLASFKGCRVLLVEDNELNREIALDILEEEGLEVEEAEDGSLAVEMLREKGPDYYNFILMDIQMPIMNGFEATRVIREMYPQTHIPIVALSANAFAEDKAKSIAAGMDAHVAKPINIGELFAALAKFL